MLWKPIAYAVLCVVVPVVWGLVVYWASSLIERRVLRKPQPTPGQTMPDDTALPLDYYI